MINYESIITETENRNDIESFIRNMTIPDTVSDIADIVYAHSSSRTGLRYRLFLLKEELITMSEAKTLTDTEIESLISLFFSYHSFSSASGDSERDYVSDIVTTVYCGVDDDIIISYKDEDNYKENFESLYGDISVGGYDSSKTIFARINNSKCSADENTPVIHFIYNFSNYFIDEYKEIAGSGVSCEIVDYAARMLEEGGPSESDVEAMCASFRAIAEITTNGTINYRN